MGNYNISLALARSVLDSEEVRDSGLDSTFWVPVDSATDIFERHIPYTVLRLGTWAGRYNFRLIPLGEEVGPAPNKFEPHPSVKDWVGKEPEPPRARERRRPKASPVRKPQQNLYQGLEPNWVLQSTENKSSPEVSQSDPRKELPMPKKMKSPRISDIHIRSMKNARKAVRELIDVARVVAPRDSTLEWMTVKVIHQEQVVDLSAAYQNGAILFSFDGGQNIAPLDQKGIYDYLRSALQVE